METNEYSLHVLARYRLDEMRAQAERSTRIRAARPAARSLRVALGHGLIRRGHRVQGVAAYSMATVDVGGAVERSSTPGAVHG